MPGDMIKAVTLPEPAGNSGGSFVQRFIEIAITLDPNQGVGQPNTFAGTGSNTVTLSGFRVSAHIEWNGSPSAASASLKVFGLDPGTMNQLSVLGVVFNSVQKNTITVSAGVGNPPTMTPIFGGTIWSAIADYNRAPVVPFLIEARTGYYNNIVPVAASSFPQSTDVATIMQGFATQMQLGFENNGVSKQIPPSYFPGTLIEQVRRAAQTADIVAEIVDAGSKLAIWPVGGSRTSLNGKESIPLLSKDTGMIGYPSLSPNGFVTVRSIFNPKIVQGGNLQIESDVVPQANRTWTVSKVDLDLESLVPKGNWMMTAMCYPKGFAAPPPGK